MKSKLFAAFVMAFFLGNVAVAEINEGFDYKRVTPAVPTITKNKIEVVELFWFGCPHCYHLEPDLNKWLANKPDNVVFLRIPAVFSKPWAIHARAYYTAKTLGLYDNGNHEFHNAFFDEYHNKKKNLVKRKELQAFFARFGVSAEDFNNTFESFAVNTKVNRAASLSKRYQLDGVPSMIVNGKYRVDGPMAGGRKGMINVMNYLIDKESKK
jgi:thiol:disulfide interchange protein DsbA